MYFHGLTIFIGPSGPDRQIYRKGPFRVCCDGSTSCCSLSERRSRCSQTSGTHARYSRKTSDTYGFYDRTDEINVGHYVAGIGRCTARCPRCGCATFFNPPDVSPGREKLLPPPQRLVFIDETSVKTNLTRLRGRSLLGKRLYGTAPFGKWRTQTVIAGLTSDALIAPWGIEGAMNGPAFDTYIETRLVFCPVI